MPVQEAADIGRRLAEFDRNLLHRPPADLGLLELRHPAEMPQLRVMLVTVFRRLTDPGGDTGALQRVHQFESVPCDGCLVHQAVEIVLVGEPQAQRRQPGIGRPLRRAKHARQRPPLLVAERGDGDPPVFAARAVGAVRRRLLVGRAVAVARPVTGRSPNGPGCWRR